MLNACLISEVEEKKNVHLLHEDHRTKSPSREISQICFGNLMKKIENWWMRQICLFLMNDETES